jgi:cell pole-organizing protein PopZ
VIHEDAAMSQPAKAQEPSMEEILASIRRIIADDETPKAPARPAVAAAAIPPLRPVTPPSPQPLRPPAPSPAAAAVNPADEDAGLDGYDAARHDDVARDDILELTESMAAQEPAAAPSFMTIDGQPDVVFTDAPAASEPPQPAPRFHDEPRRQPPPQQPTIDRSLISNSTSAAVDSAFNSLAQTVLVHNARTLEDLVREMLRPMLKHWLDDNLPGMVERIVKAEIERVSRGRG